MINRDVAEMQADQCLMYHAGLYLVGMVGLSLIGGRTASFLKTVWTIGLAAHAVALHANSDTRDQIVKWTAAGMEEGQRLQKYAVEKVSELAHA